MVAAGGHMPEKAPSHASSTTWHGRARMWAGRPAERQARVPKFLLCCPFLGVPAIRHVAGRFLRSIVKRAPEPETKTD